MELADIGKTFRRLDYETKVTGRAQYLGRHERARDVPWKNSAQPVCRTRESKASILPRR